MCGILGIAGARLPHDAASVARMRDTMSHRGPDAAGIWSDTRQGVWLGHRRLAIIDLSPDGVQPMTSGDGSLVIVFNGEIYNYQSLRSRLQSTGHRFRTKSDTEVLLAAYEQWGPAMLTELVGMFAFAIFDTRKGKLFLARDRAGEKPLFYAHQGGRLVFASELKALMEGDIVDRVIDPQSLDEYLTYGYSIGEFTMLSGVRRLPAGCCMEYNLRDDQLSVRRFWSLPVPDDNPSTDAGEHTERLQHLLMESVRSQLVADVPVGVMLSGGIDSSLVAAAAAAVSGRRIKTFTVTFPGHAEYDEAPFARTVADYLGSEHIELELPKVSFELLPQLAAQFDDPMADSSMVCTYLICQRIREHATVALGGDGCDELFGGYPHHRWMMQLDAIRRFIPPALRSVAYRAWDRFTPQGIRGRNLGLALFAADQTRMAQFNGIFSADRRRELVSSGLHARMDAERTLMAKCQHAAPHLSTLQQATRVDFQTYLAEDILNKVDRSAMLASLETRAPWLDHRIIEYAFREVPDELRATRQTSKVLPRLLCDKLLPGVMKSKKKRGFSLPLSHWLQGEWGKQMEDLLRGTDHEIFKPQAIQQLFAEQRQGRHNEHRIFTLAMFEMWRRRYNVGLPRTTTREPRLRTAA